MRFLWLATALSIIFACSGNEQSGESPELVVEADAEKERAILLEIGDAIAGDAQLDWDVGVPVHEWEGLSVDGETGLATAMSLRSRGLNGFLSPKIGMLSSLRVLSLSGNELTGEIPESLGNLSSLETLSLSNNRLTGPIPNSLGGLANLIALSLHGNGLTGEIPSELGELSSLQSLQLQENRLSGEIPDELTDLEGVRLIRLGGNDFLGCKSPKLWEVEANDFEQIAIPACSSDALVDTTPAPTIAEACTNGVVLPETYLGQPQFSRLVSDCQNLLKMKSSRGSDCDLNWEADVSMLEWDGVEVFMGLPPFYQNSHIPYLVLPWDCVSGSFPVELDELNDLWLLGLISKTDPFNEIPSHWDPHIYTDIDQQKVIDGLAAPCEHSALYTVAGFEFLVIVVGGCDAVEI